MSLQPSYFDELYEGSPDPWGFSTRAYEARKYALTSASLPRSHYRRAFEPGCSIGVLSRMLSSRVDQLVASDPSPRALEIARRDGPLNVEFVRQFASKEWAVGEFDLVVFSELRYYFDSVDLVAFISRAFSCLEPRGHLVAVHWREDLRDYPGTRAEVHDQPKATAGLWPLAHYEDSNFLLDVFGTSAAARLEGADADSWHLRL